MKTATTLVFSLILFLVSTGLSAQVFMQSIDNAAALAMSGSLTAAPNADRGIHNAALPALDQRFGILAGAALPYELTDWQAFQMQVWGAVGPNGGFAVDVQQNGLEAYREQRFAASYSRRLSDKLYLGVEGQYLRLNQQEYGAANGVSAGLSLLANPIPDIWLGGNIQNPFGIELAGATLPARLEIGGAWQYRNVMLLSVEVDKDLDREAQLRVGLEYAPIQLVRVRLGMRSEPARPAFGLGLYLPNGLSLNIGADWHNTLGISSGFMVAWTGASK